MHQTSRLTVAIALLTLAATPVHAQAWAYPAFQPPRTTPREFNFGIADADGGGTTLLFQWREENGPRNQLSLDVGLADPDSPRSDLLLFGGGQYAYQLARSNAEMPLDFLFTLGAYLAIGDFTLFRLPVGLSLGHRFDLEGAMALTPYAHPRVSIDVCGDCGDEIDLNINFDLGVNFEITRTVALRASVLLSGDRFADDAFGISLAITPQGLSRLIRLQTPRRPPTP